MKTWTKQFLVIALCALSMGCSQEWRTGQDIGGADQVNSQLDEAQSASASSFGGFDLSTLRNDPNTTVFYANACPSPEFSGCMGPILGILAVDSLDFLGNALTIDDVQQARIFFLDSPSTTDREDMLVLALAGSDGNFQYFTFSGTNASISDGVFTVDLQGPGGTLTLSSIDTTGDDLLAVIQLHMAFNGRPIGKITTLVGYGP